MIKEWWHLVSHIKGPTNSLITPLRPDYRFFLFKYHLLKGGAMVVWYHGPMPCDYFALIAEVQFVYGRQLMSIIDR